MADLRAQLQSTLGTAYALERELGGGGMARVFVATERALGRHVVVKVLSPELAQGLSADRFAREIRLAAALQEPHIVPVLTAGESNGLPYYTMPYVEGESLRARLVRGEAPSLGEAVGILRDVALALEYAHAHGVVHRDIKPENVLLSGRTAVVADFGIAKAVSAARTEAGQGPGGTLTSIGQSLGTPAYMAPEQVAGDPTDHRADLYAWGMMAYELLAGRHPFADKASTQQLMTAQVMEKPEPLVDRRPGLPPPLAALVMRCLEKEAAARPQSAAEILQALDGIGSPAAGASGVRAAALAATAGGAASRAPGDRLAAVGRRPPLALVFGLLAVVLGVTTVFIAGRKGDGAADAAPSAASPTSHRIAVLPFENLGDSADAYFADGITDAVRGKLTGLGGLEVIARASSVPYARSDKTPRQIAEELGVRYLLTGTVRWAKGANGVNRVQVSPALVEVGDAGAAANRWAQDFNADLADVFQVQGEIAGKVAEAMRVAIGGADQQRLAAVPTRNASAYDAYLRGEAIVTVAGTTPADLRRALAEYEHAVELDSSFADAWAKLATVTGRLYANSVPTPEMDRRTRDAAERALRLAPQSALSHRAMASYWSLVHNDATRAIEEVEKARTLAPRDADVLSSLGSALLRVGDYETGARHLREAQRLNPRSADMANALATALLWLRQHPEATQAAERATALLPTSLTNIQTQAMVALAEGNLPKARTILRDAGRRVNEDALSAYMATFWDVGWALEDDAQTRLFVLGPELFDDDRATWALVRAQVASWRGDTVAMRAWGDSARRETEVQRRAVPDDAQLNVLVGYALAFAGRHREAIAAGERGMSLLPSSRDGQAGRYFEHVMARIYLLAGERAKAVELLERILASPYFLSPGWLRIDPTWAPLRGDPRFERLAAAR